MKTPVLIIEDGFEYIDRAHHWLSDDFEFTRAGHGAEALALLGETAYELIYLDMNFNRTPADQLMGSWSEIAERLGGDREQAKAFLESHQGVEVQALCTRSDPPEDIKGEWFFGFRFVHLPDNVRARINQEIVRRQREELARKALEEQS